jgi:3-oxoacid CoA-transferase
MTVTYTLLETTAAAGYTNEQGHKVAVVHTQLCPKVIIYDGNVASHTPLRLWLSSGMRAVDHAIETIYSHTASETPHRLLCLATTHELFKLLPQSKADPENVDIRQRLQITAFGSLFSVTFRGGLGLSHSMGSSELNNTSLT